MNLDPPTEQSALNATILLASRDVAGSIARGWIVRGFLFGLGFWLAGIVVSVILGAIGIAIYGSIFAAALAHYRGAQ
jgi:hypothetical protein